MKKQHIFVRCFFSLNQNVCCLVVMFAGLFLFRNECYIFFFFFFASVSFRQRFRNDDDDGSLVRTK